MTSIDQSLDFMRRCCCSRPLSRITLARGFSFTPPSVRSASIEDVTDAELSQIALTAAEPFHLKGRSMPTVDVLPALKASARLVDVEYGSYDQPESFEKVMLPISAYAGFLEEGRSTVNGKPLYLAQTSLREDIPGVKQPVFLEKLFQERKADLYQAMSFIGVRYSLSLCSLTELQTASRLRYTVAFRSDCQLVRAHRWLPFEPQTLLPLAALRKGSLIRSQDEPKHFSARREDRLARRNLIERGPLGRDQAIQLGERSDLFATTRRQPVYPTKASTQS
jgi:hypothetical protein